MNRFRSLTTVTVMATAIALSGGTVAQASAPQAPPPVSGQIPSPASTSPASMPLGHEVDSEALNGWGYRHDGVKGVIRNNSDKTVVVSLRGDCDYGSVRLQPGQSSQFVNSWLYDLGRYRGIQGISLRIWQAGQSCHTAPVAQVTIADHTVYRPISVTQIGSVNNYRDGWREGQSHSEINGNTRIELKRENDGWRSRFEQPGYTDDWPVFSVNVNGIG